MIPLVIQRTGAGGAEAKGWIGGAGGWRGRLYHRYRLAPESAPSVERAVEALVRSPGTPVRGRLDAGDRGIDLELRLRAAALRVEAPALDTLGRAEDPEGVSRYRAGRATLTAGGRRTAGWLVVEETPPDRPRRAFVDYGDFLFAAVASTDRAVVVKRSRTRPGFDHLLASSATATTSPVTWGDDAVVIDGVRARVVDRDVTRGVDPGGHPVRFEVLLLGGDLSGVAFTIRPDR